MRRQAQCSDDCPTGNTTGGTSVSNFVCVGVKEIFWNISARANPLASKARS